MTDEAQVRNLDFGGMSNNPIEPGEDPCFIGFILRVDHPDGPQASTGSHADHPYGIVLRRSDTGNMSAMAVAGASAFPTFFFFRFCFGDFFVFFCVFEFFFFFFLGSGQAADGLHDVEIRMRSFDAAIEYRYVRFDGYVFFFVDRKTAVVEGEDPFDSSRSRLRLPFAQGIRGDVSNPWIVAQCLDRPLGEGG